MKVDHRRRKERVEALVRERPACLAGIMGGEALLDVDADSIRFDLVSYVPLLHPILPIRPSLLLLYSLSFFLPSMVALAWDTAARRHV